MACANVENNKVNNISKKKKVNKLGKKVVLGEKVVLEETMLQDDVDFSSDTILSFNGTFSSNFIDLPTLGEDTIVTVLNSSIIKSSDTKQRRKKNLSEESKEFTQSLYVLPPNMKHQTGNTFVCCNGFSNDYYNKYITCTEQHSGDRSINTWEDVLYHRGHVFESKEVVPLRSEKCPLCSCILAGIKSVKQRHLKQHLEAARELCKLSTEATTEEIETALYALPKIFITPTGYTTEIASTESTSLIPCKYYNCRNAKDEAHCKKFSHPEPVESPSPVPCKYYNCRNINDKAHCDKFSHPEPVKKDVVKVVAVEAMSPVITKPSPVMTTVSEKEDKMLIQCKYHNCRNVKDEAHCLKFSHSPSTQDQTVSLKPPALKKKSELKTEMKETELKTKALKETELKLKETEVKAKALMMAELKAAELKVAELKAAELKAAELKVAELKAAMTKTATIVPKDIKRKLSLGTIVEEVYPTSINSKCPASMIPLKKAIVPEATLEDKTATLGSSTLLPDVLHAKDKNGNMYPIKVPFDYVLEDNCEKPDCNCGKNHIEPSLYKAVLPKGSYMPINMCWNEQPKTKLRCYNPNCNDGEKSRLHLKNHYQFVQKHRAATDVSAAV